jgi:hypothetical protein
MAQATVIDLDSKLIPLWFILLLQAFAAPSFVASSLALINSPSLKFTVNLKATWILARMLSSFQFFGTLRLNLVSASFYIFSIFSRRCKLVKFRNRH